MTLRTRLVLIVATIAIVAIVAVDLATYQSLRSSLMDRVDRQLQDVAGMAPPGEGRGDRPEEQRGVPTGTWKGVFVGGELRAEFVAGLDGDSITAADRPELETVKPSTQLYREPTTIDAQSGDGRFRVKSRGLRGEDVMIAAIPLDDLDATLDRLVQVELVVSIVAALVVALLSFIAVRAGLRPLEHIATAATRISHDDGPGISERVPIEPRQERTEVGRLATALNEMLDRIDGSFAAQQATQEQLRRFVADASHELRTPLTSIQGYAELARTRAAEMTDEERDTALRRVEEESEHVSRLVEDLLLLSRLDEGLPMHVSEVDIAAIAATSVDAARVIDPRRSIEFESSGPAIVRADPVRVRQLVDNLLANARTHAGDDADVTVEVATLPSGGACLEVRDTGVGIPEGAHGIATDRFWRADTARGRATGGSGLGLSIVRSIAEAHGGWVELAPGPDGRGLAVTVALVGA